MALSFSLGKMMLEWVVAFEKRPAQDNGSNTSTKPFELLLRAILIGPAGPATTSPQEHRESARVEISRIFFICRRCARKRKQTGILTCFLSPRRSLPAFMQGRDDESLQNHFLRGTLLARAVVPNVLEFVQHYE